MPQFRNRYFVAEDGSLKIQKLAMEDGGMFQCVASNSAGQATAYTWLKVKSTFFCYVFSRSLPLDSVWLFIFVD